MVSINYIRKTSWCVTICILKIQETIGKHLQRKQSFSANIFFLQKVYIHIPNAMQDYLVFCDFTDV